MGYTYDNFISAATQAGMADRFTEEDLQIARANPEYGLGMLALMRDTDNATTPEQRLLATEATNQLRQSYGATGAVAGVPTSAAASAPTSAATGGTDVPASAPSGTAASSEGMIGAYNGSHSSTIEGLTDQIGSYGSFGYDNQGQYDQVLGQIVNYDPYSYGNQGKYQQVLDSIVDQKPFSYDHQEDPSWSAYKKAYLREGERASANALAQAAAASGGRASSYALSAAQQAGNYYAAQLADMLPTLEQNAYARYVSDFERRLQGFGALQSDRAFDYQTYLDRFGQLQSGLNALQSDRNFDYKNWLNQYDMLQNSLGNYQNLDATEYQRYLDVYDQQRQAELDRDTRDQQAWENQYLTDEVARNQAQQEWTNAYNLYLALGYATPEIAEVLGIEPGTPAPSTGNTGSGNAGTGTGTTTGTGATTGGTTNAGNDTSANNGKLTENDVKALQTALGVTADGMYGPQSRAAAAGLDADEAYEFFVRFPYDKWGSVKVDWQSLWDLGYPADYDPAYVSQLIGSGSVEASVDANGRVTFQVPPEAGDVTYDWQSLWGLGYAPTLTAGEIWDLIDAGKVEMVTENGVVRFRKPVPVTSASAMGASSAAHNRVSSLM